ncbi:MAG: hypothetical protein AMJ62_02990 [Myxococcales bacterium SG8_38]|nr:MAG: hypothetical protein AMJ62_02990 [Myxococcales bacterium SG8_38]
MIDPVVALSLRLALSLLFVVAAWHKVSDLRRFTATVRAYELLPEALPSFFARVLPLAEAAIAVGLLYDPTQAAASVAAASILVLYAGAIGINLARGRREIDCGCFASSSPAPLSPWLLTRNLVLATAAGALVWPSRERALLWVDWMTVTATLIVLALLWSAGRRLAGNGLAPTRLGGNR